MATVNIIAKPDWVLNHQHQQLYSGQRVVSLDDKQYALLMLLMDNANMDVTKEQIFTTLWPGRVVSEDAIYVTVTGLRKLLGDNVKQPSYIKTITGVGYRWVGPQIGADKSVFSSSLMLCSAILLLGAALLGSQFNVLSDPIPMSPEQSENFQKARYLLSHQPDSIGQSIALLQQLTLARSDLIEPQVWLADAYLRQLLEDPSSNAHHRNRAHALLQSVLTKTPEHLKANLLMAQLTLLIDFEPQAARRYFKAALGHAEGHHWFGQFLLATGDFQGALEHIEQYRLLDPNGYSSESVAWVYTMSQRYEAALDTLLKLQPYSDTSRFYHTCLRTVYEQLGEYDKAFAKMQWVMQDAGYSSPLMAQVESAFARDGLSGVYRWLLHEDPLRADIGHYTPPMSLARYAVMAGEPQVAVAYLNQAFETRQQAVLWAAVDPVFTPLHEYPPYQQFVQRLNIIAR
ncbi:MULTISPECIES: winged helix-turn-helix domain-containing protein [unclassified Pseudoalteromonas]|uniref:winged helix-turn-helix domain-containing protein n=1 Tax=unclassified Pseudoalteromonas TaxID=194690 RepID=UPI00209722CC|nr:winged helix-turn-helix domain-containing protein [Pseudoalteromonas sp. XMcav2-N]MCO7190809.1 winged helix-turn-helix domain-containing protein [Pseudoalteromonas sp. XMcav2-N]